jgi:hypothetical protein
MLHRLIIDMEARHTRFAKRLPRREQGEPGDLLRPSFGNVTVPAQILPLLRNETRPPPIYSDA